mmetsp:Transcript_2189/g.6611  ORF Transcript_2189/g.6611 Transcript_2189/m.6611 type:complete len:282 (+) Transcript_2189:167-1012(+)
MPKRKRGVADANKDQRIDERSSSGDRQPLCKEIAVRTTWAPLLTDVARARVRQIGSHEVWLVEELFSASECASLLRAAEAHGFGTTDYDQAYRGNLRLTTTDLGLADAVWSRLRDLVPAKVSLTEPRFATDKHWWSHYPGHGGSWEACSLNECWRLAKYRAGDRFSVHCDQAFERTEDEMSMLSVNIYMNDGFSGGRTRFWLSDDPYFECRSSFGVPDFEIVPRAGSCLLFRQPPGRSYWHDGELVGFGTKYLFRSDVMYRKVRLPKKDTAHAVSWKALHS